MFKPHTLRGWAGLAGILLTLAPAPALAQSELPLAEAIRIAQARRHEVNAATAAAEAANGAVLQASLRPNPTLSIQSENWRAWGDPSFGPARDLDFFVFASQTVETAGKRRKRTELAETQGAAAELARDVLAWRIEQQVTEAWWSALAAQQRLALVEESLATVAELVAYHQSRLEQGAVAEIELIKVQVEEQKLAQAVAEALNQLEQARLALAAAMGEEQVQRPLAAKLPQHDLTTNWQARALERRPDLSLQRARVASANAAVTLAEAQARPNVTPYFGYKRSNDFNTLVGGVTIPLAVSDRNQGGIAEAQARLRQEEATLRALSIRAEAEVRSALAAAERAKARHEQLESGLLERARESYQIARAAYQEQGTDLLFLLDAQRAQNDAALLSAQALADYRFRLAQLQIVSGGHEVQR